MATLVYLCSVRTACKYQYQSVASRLNRVTVVSILSCDDYSKTRCFASRHLSSRADSEGAVRRTWKGFLSVVKSFSRGARTIFEDLKKIRLIQARMGSFRVTSSAPDLATVQFTSQEFRFVEEVRVWCRTTYNACRSVLH